MPNAITISKPVESGYERSAVVCDDLFDGSPSTQDIFENECGEHACGFDVKGAPFGPGSEGASCLNDVAEASGGRHQHCVDIRFAEEGRRGGDCWRDVDFGGLSNLALVAGGNVLLNIVSE